MKLTVPQMTKPTDTLPISDVQIAPIRPREGLLAFCSVVLADQIFLGGIGLHTAPAPRYYRLVYPARSTPDGKHFSYVHPITRELSEAIERAVGKKFEEVMTRWMPHATQDRERRFHSPSQ